MIQHIHTVYIKEGEDEKLGHAAMPPGHQYYLQSSRFLMTKPSLVGGICMVYVCARLLVTRPNRIHIRYASWQLLCIHPLDIPCHTSWGLEHRLALEICNDELAHYGTI